MFTINTDRCIKMNIGDDVQFPLFLNNGTRSNPVRYEFEKDDGCEVYFYILSVNGCYDNFILKKTFNTNGTITTEKGNSDEIEEYQVDSIINDNKDIVITLDSSDTIDLCPNEYIYVVRAKILTEKINSKNIVKNNEYTTIQITNRYYFYLLDDNINRAEG